MVYLITLISNMEIISTIYIIAFFILSVILLVSIVVLRNEKDIDDINQKIDSKKSAKNK